MGETYVARLAGRGVDMNYCKKAPGLRLNTARASDRLKAEGGTTIRVAEMELETAQHTLSQVTGFLLANSTAPRNRNVS